MENKEFTIRDYIVRNRRKLVELLLSYPEQNRFDDSEIELWILNDTTLYNEYLLAKATHKGHNG